MFAVTSVLDRLVYYLRTSLLMQKTQRNGQRSVITCGDDYFGCTVMVVLMLSRLSTKNGTDKAKAKHGKAKGYTLMWVSCEV